MMETVKVMSVIETRLLKRGTGISADPIRIVTQYWDMNGNLIFEIDPERIADLAEKKKLYEAIRKRINDLRDRFKLDGLNVEGRDCALHMVINDIWSDLCKIVGIEPYIS